MEGSNDLNEDLVIPQRKSIVTYDELRQKNRDDYARSHYGSNRYATIVATQLLIIAGVAFIWCSLWVVYCWFCHFQAKNILISAAKINRAERQQDNHRHRYKEHTDHQIHLDQHLAHLEVNHRRILIVVVPIFDPESTMIRTTGKRLAQKIDMV